MVQIRWLKEARNDLKEIYEFIVPDSKRYAKYQIEQIRDRTQLLKVYPLSGKVVRELDDQNLREIVSGNYRIIYRVVSTKQIHIILIYGNYNFNWYKTM